MTLLRTTARASAVLVLAAGLAAAAAHAPESVVVGALENPPFGCDNAHDPKIAVRPLFEKSGGTWAALDDRAAFLRAVPGPMSWTVAFDGKDIGAIRTLAPELLRDRRPGFSALRDGILTLAPGERPPRRTTPGIAYQGWCRAPERPLVTVSRPNFADPDIWKSFRATPDLRVAALPAFRAGMGNIHPCADTSRTPAPLRYSAQDLEIVRGYRNRRGQMVLALKFADRVKACAEYEGPEDETGDPQWLVLGDTTAFLGAGFQLVDAGDYDGDGRSELVFAYSSYNADGYTLVADDFRTRAAVRWGYH